MSFKYMKRTSYGGIIKIRLCGLSSKPYSIIFTLKGQTGYVCNVVNKFFRITELERKVDVQNHEFGLVRFQNGYLIIKKRRRKI